MTVLSLIIPLRFGERQGELEYCAAAAVAAGCNAPPVCFDDRSTDRKTNSHSARLAGHKRLKQLLCNFRSDAGASISHEENGKLLLVCDTNGQFSSAGSFHCLDTISDQIECHLLDLNLVDNDARKVTIATERYAHALLSRADQSKCRSFLKQRSRVFDRVLGFPFRHKFTQTLDDISCS